MNVPFIAFNGRSANGRLLYETPVVGEPSYRANANAIAYRLKLKNPVIMTGFEVG
jgi:hypothetical protein